MKGEQGLSDGFSGESPDLGLVVKFYLALGRMDIDVHPRRIDSEKQTADGYRPFISAVW
jgi:hypothetical protein